MDLKLIQKKWSQGKWQMTVHARHRLGQRKITFEDIEQVILSGEIIRKLPS